MEAILSSFLQQSIQCACPVDIELLKRFSAIKIIDSSSWKISNGLKHVMPGFTGAGCRIQLMLDYLSGAVSFLDVTEETYNDKKYTSTLAKIVHANELYIFDLGYVVTALLDAISSAKAFFISRYNHKNISLFFKKEMEFVKADLLKLLNQLPQNNVISDLECYVGNENKKIKVRFIAFKVPEEVANIRRMKLKKNAAKKGNTPSDKALQLCAWSLFMTNITTGSIMADIDVKTILAFYPIRWTVEIYFKQFKSILGIHKSSVKKNENRLKCELLGKLIAATYIAFLYSKARTFKWEKDKQEISFAKTVDYFQRHAGEFTSILKKAATLIVAYINKLIKIIIKNCVKERQRTRKNSLDQLISGTIFENYSCESPSPERITAMN